MECIADDGELRLYILYCTFLIILHDFNACINIM